MKIHSARTTRTLLLEYVVPRPPRMDGLAELRPALPAHSEVTAIHLGGDHWHINGQAVGGEHRGVPGETLAGNVCVNALELGPVLAAINEGGAARG